MPRRYWILTLAFAMGSIALVSGCAEKHEPEQPPPASQPADNGRARHADAMADRDAERAMANIKKNDEQTPPPASPESRGVRNVDQPRVGGGRP